MARKTTEELKQELKTLQENYNEAVEVQKNCQNRAIAINAILTDRAEEETEKKQQLQESQLESALFAEQTFIRWSKEGFIAVERVELDQVVVTKP